MPERSSPSWCSRRHKILGRGEEALANSPGPPLHFHASQAGVAQLTRRKKYLERLTVCSIDRLTWQEHVPPAQLPSFQSPAVPPAGLFLLELTTRLVGGNKVPRSISRTDAVGWGARLIPPLCLIAWRLNGHRPPTKRTDSRSPSMAFGLTVPRGDQLIPHARNAWTHSEARADRWLHCGACWRLCSGAGAGVNPPPARDLLRRGPIGRPDSPHLCEGDQQTRGGSQVGAWATLDRVCSGLVGLADRLSGRGRAAPRPTRKRCAGDRGSRTAGSSAVQWLRE
jgi:hypothetical protein